MSGLVDEIEPKESGTGSSSKTVRQYKKTTLRSGNNNEGNLTKGKIVFSRVAKLGLLALRRGNDETHCSGLVDGIEPKESGTGSNSKTVHQYKKTTLLRSEKKNGGNLTKGKTMFSRVAKLGLLALGRGNDEIHCSGWEKNALP